MIDRSTTFDVFLVHSPKDAGLAHLLIDEFDRANLSVWSFTDLAPSVQVSDTDRDNLIDSWAVVLLITPNARRSNWMAFEVGMAHAWSKPIFVVYDGLDRDELPPYLNSFPIFSVAEIDRVAKQILELQLKMSPEQVSALAESYRMFGVPSERLMLNRGQLHRLTTRFNAESGSQFTSEQLAQELLRMRKRGELPRLEEAAPRG